MQGLKHLFIAEAGLPVGADAALVEPKRDGPIGGQRDNLPGGTPVRTRVQKGKTPKGRGEIVNAEASTSSLTS